MRALAHADRVMNRIYGSRYNPLYQSGTIASFLLAVLLITGLYLLLFYRIGDPHASVVRINEQVWGGRWIRALHRYASAAMLVAVGVHALRMLLQRRSWGPRALAWLSGLALVGVMLIAGWTGYVMIWDEHGHVLAVQGARLIDLFPLFSEPVIRAFSGSEPVPGAFFFLNLFLHIALPVGMALMLWLHVSRIARPNLLPPRGLWVGILVLLTATAVIWPLPVWPEADLLALPGTVPLDLFYGWWIVPLLSLPPWLILVLGGAGVLVLALVPKIQGRAAVAGLTLEPSFVDERLCTGCEQCYVDCPYDAIQMTGRSDGRRGLVALVDPTLCVSCGICAGSCAPMGVGPPGRTGRDQLTNVRTLLHQAPIEPGAPVIIACSRGVGGIANGAAFEGSRVISVDCAGNLHTSIIELLVKQGAGGVLVGACPPRDCWNREGAIWLEQRMFHDREAELQSRVDRRRVALVTAGLGEVGIVSRALEALKRQVAAIPPPEADDGKLGAECDRPQPEERQDALPVGHGS